MCIVELGATPDLTSLRAARLLAVADVVFAGPAAEPLLANHGRRDAERPDPATACAAVLAELVERGRIVAVVGGTVDVDLVSALRAYGVEVEVLMSAAVK